MQGGYISQGMSFISYGIWFVNSLQVIYMKEAILNFLFAEEKFCIVFLTYKIWYLKYLK